VVIDGVGRVDFLVAGRVIVETDGRAFHVGAESFARDRRRDRAAARLGLRVLRYTYAEVLGAPELIVDDVRAVLRLLAA
jgi:very-short-patch-repair endonuclease